MNKNNKELDLLELLRYTIGCTYISDLRTEPYNAKARLVLRQFNLKKFPCNQISDVFEYIYSPL